jgi:hypothetical protein
VQQGIVVMDSLPPEIISIIIYFMDDLSRRTIRLANMKWFTKIQYKNFTCYKTMAEQLPQILDRLSKYTFPLELAFLRSQCPITAELFKSLGRLTQLRRLELGNILWNWCTPVQDLHPLTNLTNLEQIDQRIPPDIYCHYINLRRLDLRSTVTKPIRNLTRFTKLDTITWLFDEENPPTYDPLLLIPNPLNLTYLALDVLDPPPNSINESTLERFSNLKRLIISKGQTMVNLRFNIPHLPNLEVLKLQNYRVDSISNLNTKLTRLKITCDQINRSAIMYLESLQQLSIHSSVDCSGLDLLTNLRQLKLNYSKEIDPDFQYLSALTQLEKLMLNTKNGICSPLLISSTRLTTFIWNGDVVSMEDAKLHNPTLN